MDKKLISQAMSELGKRSHKKSPRSKEHYREMGRKSVASRKAKKELSTDSLAE